MDHIELWKDLVSYVKNKTIVEVRIENVEAPPKAPTLDVSGNFDIRFHKIEHFLCVEGSLENAFKFSSWKLFLVWIIVEELFL